MTFRLPAAAVALTLPLTLATSIALAEEEPGFVTPATVTASPFEYARSGAKADRAKGGRRGQEPR
jgi:hypothetical protein